MLQRKEREEVTREQIFEDYQCLLQMNANRKCKIKTLELLVSQATNNWRVVGITRAALAQFADQDFLYKTGRGITRAHVHDRNTTFGQLIDMPEEETQFWASISDRDRTILATRGENSSVNFENAIPIPDFGLLPQAGLPILFKSKSVGYRFGAAESQYLRELHAAHF